MSMYNMLFGENASQKDFLFELLGKTPSDFGRYRDIFVDEDHIIVHTRCGGGNREYYEEVFSEMEDHPLFDYDMDDDFDCTYCNFFFNHPEGYGELLKEMATDTITPAEKWKLLFESMEGSK